MMQQKENEIVLTDEDLKNKDYVKFNFYKEGKPLSFGPECFLSLKKAGSMRFRWAEKNPNRENFFKNLTKKQIVALELIHSKKVYNLINPCELKKFTGDGIITKNTECIPVLTVADCMPLYFYDPVKEVFGLVHSGWKGTGIIKEAVKLAQKEYNCNPKDFLILIGPHIRDCCYIVDEERQKYFSSNFTSTCVRALEEGGVCYAGGRGLATNWNNKGTLYRLSLEKANLSVIEKMGIPKENITIVKNCTCCQEELGSNRRETADFQSKSGKTTDSSNNYNNNPPPFTVMAAFIGNL